MDIGLKQHESGPPTNKKSLGAISYTVNRSTKRLFTLPILGPPLLKPEVKVLIRLLRLMPLYRGIRSSPPWKKLKGWHGP